jgi:D-arabinose 1-dehydrogenase-like Zn-dependent alcohol dehydrogenase
MERPFWLLLCTANAGINLEVLFMALKKRGRPVLLGFPDVAFISTDLVVHELSITGSFLDNRAAMREMLSFVQAHSITPEVELVPMSQVNAAFQRVRDNQARYRIVLVNDLVAAQSEVEA